MEGQAPPSVPKVEYHTANIAETAQLPALIVKAGKILAVVGFDKDGLRFTDVSKNGYTTTPINFDEWQGLSSSGYLYRKSKHDDVFYWNMRLDKLVEIVSNNIGYLCDPLAWSNGVMNVRYNIDPYDLESI